MGMVPKYDQLAAMTDNELIACYNEKAKHTVVGTAFYREELTRRQLINESKRMLNLTRTMARLTWMIFALTIANVGIAFCQLLNA